MRARSKRERRLARTVHLRLFTNREEFEDDGKTDGRPTSCGLHGTPHYVEEHKATHPDCHVNIFDASKRVLNQVELMTTTTRSAPDSTLALCAVCKKRVELMFSLGGLS